MLTHVLHTGFEVDDLGETVQLYKKLGFEVEREVDKPEPKGKFVHLRKGDTMLEFWQFEDKTHPQVAFIHSHIALYSDSLEEDIEEFVNKGYKIVIPMTEGVVLRYAFVQDPSGLCYEIATQK